MVNKVSSLLRAKRLVILLVLLAFLPQGTLTAGRLVAALQ
jgi:hypothetical protein